MMYRVVPTKIKIFGISIFTKKKEPKKTLCQFSWAEIKPNTDFSAFSQKADHPKILCNKGLIWATRKVT